MGANECVLIFKPWIIVGYALKQTMEEKYVSLCLVYSYWVNLGDYREIGDACAHNDLLDDRARHPRIDHRWRRYSHVFAPDKRTISSRRPGFFHTGRDPGSLRLL